jgi:hypothetical protein
MILCHSNVGWKRLFQQISNPKPGHLRAFDRIRELIHSVDDDDMGRCGIMATLKAKEMD